MSLPRADTMTSDQELSLDRLMQERASRFNTSRHAVEQAVSAFWLGKGATVEARNDNVIARRAGCTTLDDFLAYFAKHVERQNTNAQSIAKL